MYEGTTCLVSCLLQSLERKFQEAEQCGELIKFFIVDMSIATSKIAMSQALGIARPSPGPSTEADKALTFSLNQYVKKLPTTASSFTLTVAQGLPPY